MTLQLSGRFRIEIVDGGSEAPTGEITFDEKSCRLAWYHAARASEPLISLAEGTWHNDGGQINLALISTAGLGPSKYTGSFALDEAVRNGLDGSSPFELEVSHRSEQGEPIQTRVRVTQAERPVVEDLPLLATRKPSEILTKNKRKLKFSNNLAAENFTPSPTRQWSAKVGPGVVTVSRNGSSCCSKTESISVNKSYSYENNDSNCKDKATWSIEAVAGDGTPRAIQLALKPGDEMEFVYHVPDDRVPQINFAYILNNGPLTTLGMAAQGQSIG